MTVERRLLLGLADIFAVTFECKRCGVRLTLAPDKVSVDALQRCPGPGCSAEWVNGAQATPHGRSHGGSMARFLAALPLARESQAEGGDAKVRIFFEFQEPTEATR